MTNPIDAAKALTPWWMMEIHCFDALEIHPCHSEDPISQPSEVAQQECWSIFGRRTDTTLEHFEVFTTEAEARDFAETMLRAWPHLTISAAPD